MCNLLIKKGDTKEEFLCHCIADVRKPELRLFWGLNHGLFLLMFHVYLEKNYAFSIS